MIENGWTEELDRLRRELADTQEKLRHANDTLRRYEERFDDFRAFINQLCDLIEARQRGSSK